MAEVNIAGNEGKKGKPKRMSLRVDFTPMVDMNMLLITFFMFCTTLTKPQAMDLTIPTKEKSNPQPNQIPSDKAVTIILGENDKVFYYFGKPDYNNPTTMKVTSYGSNGLRKILLDRNTLAANRMKELRSLRQKKQISEIDFKTQSKLIQNDDNNMVAIIKPTEGASYENLVDVLDEMHICSIGKYAIVDMADGDKFLMNHIDKKM